MKKILSAVLAVLMIVSVLAFVGCDSSEQKAETLKFGMGVYAYYGDVTSADADTNGSAEVDMTVAAVLLDAEGKIVKADFDTAASTVKYTSAGQAVAAGEFQTKEEKGTNYGMVAYGGATLEWYEQVDALEGALVGKTIEEAKAMVVDGYKGNDEVINAGCTIGVADFIYALEKAVANAADSDATADCALNIGVVTTQSNTDATEEAEGTIELDSAVVAAAVKDGKVVVASSDTLQVKIKFDIAGASTIDATAALPTKVEKGTGYGMSAHGTDRNGDGVVKEWNEQADVFDAACAGLDAAGIAALAVDDGYGVESLQTAGCTMGVSELVAAAVKAATIG